MAGATVTRAAVRPGDDELEAALGGDSTSPRWWSNAAGDRYGWHAHDYRKVLYCAEGSIVFHLRDGDIELGPGDRLEVDPGTDHAATVGPHGVKCVEAAAAS
ncbi:MAG TPA: cupin domain-containing protein [Actinomycetota bacterium]|nr:cupin domain-containing protein [Actinomycetota bacterium]